MPYATRASVIDVVFRISVAQADLVPRGSGTCLPKMFQGFGPEKVQSSCRKPGIRKIARGNISGLAPFQSQRCLLHQQSSYSWVSTPWVIKPSQCRVESPQPLRRGPGVLPFLGPHDRLTSPLKGTPLLSALPLRGQPLQGPSHGLAPLFWDAGS